MVVYNKKGFEEFTRDIDTKDSKVFCLLLFALVSTQIFLCDYYRTFFYFIMVGVKISKKMESSWSLFH